MNRTTFSREHRRSRTWFLCQAALVSLLLPVLFSSAGCGKKGPKNTVSGTVTLKGQAVAGTVTFLGDGAKEGVAPIKPDGTYTMIDPPPGTVKVVVKGSPAMPGMQRPMPMPKDAPPEMPKTSMGVPPPAKYASPNNGLTFNVTGGDQKYDIELMP